MKRLVSLLSHVLIVAVCGGAGLWLGPRAAATYDRLFPEPAFERADNTAHFRQAGTEVVVFGTTTCPYCAKTRALLGALGVRYQERLIDQSPQARQEYEALAAQGVPVILIGDRRIHGFNESAIRDALSVRGLGGPDDPARGEPATGTTAMENPT